MGIRSLLRNAFGRSKATREETGAAQNSAAPESATIPEAREESTPAAPATSPKPSDKPSDKPVEAEVPAARTAPAEHPSPEPAPTPTTATLPAQGSPVDRAEKPVRENEAEPKAKDDDKAETHAPEADTAAPDTAASELVSQAFDNPTPATKPEPPTAPEPQATAEAEATPEVEATAEAEATPEVEATAEAESTPEVEATAEVEAAPEVEAKSGAEAEAESEAEAEPVQEATPEPAAETPAAEPEAKPEPEAEADPEAEAAPKAEDAPEAEAAPETEAAPEAEAAPEPEAATVPEVATVPEAKGVPAGLRPLHASAGATLEKHGLSAQRAVVYLVLDRSGSMRNYYKDGTVQNLAEQALALSAHFDDEPTVPVVFFSTDIDGTADLDLTNYEGRIEELHAGLGHMGRTNYHWAVNAVVEHYKKSGTTAPAFVIFQTDGAPTSKPAAEKALCEAAKLPIFWQFIGFGDPEAKGFDFLRKLDDLTVPEKRAVDNAGFFHAGRDPRSLSHDELYQQLMVEFPEWLTEARTAKVLKDD
ncbi:VWA domain-containing protein [Streptomyces sp. NPDC048197]|uniref:VWA domain-containing protein n=1 Tax=Streptomyces sp. NPDC048197 TaxID=3365511 RepID=UPI003719E41A